jgi:hypothetical protein
MKKGTFQSNGCIRAKEVTLQASDARLLPEDRPLGPPRGVSFHQKSGMGVRPSGVVGKFCRRDPGGKKGRFMRHGKTF